ncbi:major facilitator transporter [Tepidicaulis marinus]|uniref:Major facilitator transporter n=1 Tax=Tepidicaulis marinus TaxID=1333998 RepID=A0A081B9T1_9HYPH|nr:MFS transporter [Tepidicaulis marinus]GAK44799.1 major facilitator transporter [Tepidicaulis marinus]
MPLAARLGLFYAAVFIFPGVHLPFFPVWLGAQALTPAQISIVLSGAMLLRILAGPALAFLADRAENRRGMMLALAAVSFCAAALYFLADGFLPIFLISLVLMTLYPSIIPMTESLAMRAVREEGMDYGRVRLWGSVSFIVASYAMGWWLLPGRESHILAAMLFGIALTFSVGFLLPAEGRKDSAAPPLSWANALKVLRHPVFLGFVLAAGLTQSSHAFLYAFGSLNWQRLGLSETLIGFLWALGVVAEISLFMASAWLARVFGPVGLVVLAAGAGVLRWLITAQEPGLAVLCFAQALHGLSFGAAHLGAMHFIARAVTPELAATAQSLYAAVSGGIMMAGFMALSGPLYEAAQSTGFYVMAGVALMGAGAALVTWRRWQGGLLVDAA